MPTARIAAALTCALLAACGGGSSHAVPATNAPRSGSAVVRLTIPAATAAAAAHRSPKYVSPSTQSLLITVQTVNNAPTAFPAIALNVVVPSATCPAPAQGGQNETCTFPVVLPVGSVQFTVTAYDHTLSGTTPQGNALSSNTVNQTLSGNGDPILLTLDGVPVRATLFAGTSPLAVGTAASVSVSASAYDADNNLIIGPGSYTKPITVAVTDPLGRLSVAQPTIGGPGATATLTYSGAAGLTSATVTGSAAGVTVTPATKTFVPGLVRSDALSQVTSPVHYLTLAPGGATAAIPYQDASNANAPTLLLVNVATRAVIAHTQLVTQAMNANAIVSNVAFSSASPGTALAGYSDTLTVNGVASINAATGALIANVPTTFAPQFLAALAGSPNDFAFGTPPAGGSGSIEQFSATSGAVFATQGSFGCALYDQCLVAAPDGSRVFAPDQSANVLVTMRPDGSTLGSIATPDGPVTAQTFSADGRTLYLASTQTGGTTALDALAYPASTTPTAVTTLPSQFSALAMSPDSTTLFASSSLSSSPVTIVDLASRTAVSFGPTLTLGQFAGGFVSPVPLATSGSRRFLVLRQYQQPAGTYHTTLDEYVY